jgi:hypothetical protein
MKNIKPSRQRRKDAVNAARDSVYANDGNEYNVSFNPYCKETNERQHRIFEKYYLDFYNKYHYYEDVLSSM